VADVLDPWREVNEPIWSVASRRDYASRAGFVANDSIGTVPLARLGVTDVERWHARMRGAGVGEAAIRGRHSALRAALTQAVRWGWVGTNVASAARLRSAKRSPRASMSLEDVRAVITAARVVDPSAALAFRLAAVAGARRAELAALRWDDVGKRITIDSSVTVARGTDEGGPVLSDSSTKTGDRRVVRLDDVTIAEIERGGTLRRGRDPAPPRRAAGAKRQR